MAKIFADKLENVSGVKITQPVQSNGLFVIMSSEVAEKMQSHYFFYPWNEKISEYRLMTSWDTTEEDIDGFINMLSHELMK